MQGTRGTWDLAEPGCGASTDADGKSNVFSIGFLSLKEYTEQITRCGGVLELPDVIEASAGLST